MKKNKTRKNKPKALTTIQNKQTHKTNDIKGFTFRFGRSEFKKAMCIYVGVERLSYVEIHATRTTTQNCVVHMNK